jgi:hypothetical protein
MLTHGRPGGRRVLLDPAPGDPRGGRPVVLSEFGGLSTTGRGARSGSAATVTSPDELLDRFGELLHAVTDSPRLAGFCYPQLTDTEQETNGLLTADRRPKLPPERIRALVTRPSAAMPTDARDHHRRAVAGESDTGRGAVDGAERAAGQGGAGQGGDMPSTG